MVCASWRSKTPYARSNILEAHVRERERVIEAKAKGVEWGEGLCNIPEFGVTKRDETDVRIEFMHKKSGKFSRFQIKLVTVTEVSLELMELKWINKSSAINLHVIFAKTYFG
jgi:hypothetical protein